MCQNHHINICSESTQSFIICSLSVHYVPGTFLRVVVTAVSRIAKGTAFTEFTTYPENTKRLVPSALS